MLGALGFAEQPVGDPDFDRAAEILRTLVAKPHNQPIMRDQMSQTNATFREIEAAIGPPDGSGSSVDHNGLPVAHHGLRRYSQGKLTVINFGRLRVIYRDWRGDP